VVYSEFIRNVFAKSPSDIALFVDRGMIMSSNKQPLFLAFFGGPDDRLALHFLVQLCERPWVTATVVRLNKVDPTSPTEETKTGALLSPNVHHTVAAADTVYGQPSTEIRLASDTADNIAWDHYTRPNASRSPSLTSTLSRITFLTESSPTPLHRVTELANEQAAKSVAESGKTIIVLAGRSRRLAVESLKGELTKLTADSASPITSSVPKTLGDIGAALVATNVNASLLVLQAAPSV
jgi:hypothetical protein